MTVQRKMKNSGIQWIGDIPQEWKTIKLKYVVSYNDDILDENTNKNFTFDYIDIGSVEYGKGIVKCERMTYRNAPSRARRIVKKDDIILSTVRTYLKAIATISEFDVPQIVSTGFIVLRAIENKISPRFLNFAVLSTAFISMIECKSVGISYPAINSSEVVNLFLPVPNINEQQRIADFLDKKCEEIDNIITRTKATIEEYKKLKQSVITQAVTKGIRKNRPMKDSGIDWIGDIPQDYYIIKLKFLLNSNLQYGANETGINFNSSLPRYIRITDITQDGKLKNDGKLSIELKKATPFILNDGDILFARSGATVGKTFIYKRCYGLSAFAGYLIRATISKNYLPMYIYMYTNSSLYELWKNSIFIQSTIQNIGADKYSNLPIVIPNSLKEQQEIVSYLDEKCSEIDKLIRKKEQLLDELENYKKSLIYEYVTGKKEVLS